MTPRRPAILPPAPLTLENAVGNGVPATPDLIAVQTAILNSNAAVLGAVNEFRAGIDQRLDRQFGDLTASLVSVEGKVDGANARLGCLEEARRLDAALAANAKATATERNADRTAHALSTNQRAAIVVSAIAACGGVALGFLNFWAGK